MNHLTAKTQANANVKHRMADDDTVKTQHRMAVVDAD